MGFQGRHVAGLTCILTLGSAIGCAGMEYAPKKGIWYYHRELPAAEKAVDGARVAGKDRECPAEFQAAEKAKNEAYEIYWSCRTQEGIAKANEATALARALCPRAAEPPKPAPAAAPPAPLPAPTVSLSASPTAVDRGQCATLTWSSTSASSASIEPGIGNVPASGTRQVCPDATTAYSISASGEGGTRSASTTVAVNSPPPAPRVVDRLTVRVNFDSNSAAIREDAVPELQRAIDFVKRYPGYKVSVEGHTDDRGSAEVNQILSERRAEAVKDYLLSKGAGDRETVTAVGYGESRPAAANATAEGRFANRRVEILVLAP